MKSESNFEYSLPLSDKYRGSFESFQNIVNLEKILDYSEFNVEVCEVFRALLLNSISIMGIIKG